MEKSPPHPMTSPPTRPDLAERVCIIFFLGYMPPTYFAAENMSRHFEPSARGFMKWPTGGPVIRRRSDSRGRGGFSEGV